jgi:DNA invertase Pin-like site-specific DNA recombinase
MEQGIIWARVSTKEQAEEGYSLDAQLKMLRDYSQKNNLKIIREFIVPESASGRQERKKFLEMLGFLKDNQIIKHLVCEKVDRITRNFQDAVKLDNWLNGQL